MSFGFRCGNRYTAADKVGAAHGFPCEESIISFGPQRGKGSWESGGGPLKLVTGCASGRGLLCDMFSFFMAVYSTRHEIMLAHDKLVFCDRYVDSNQDLTDLQKFPPEKK